LFKQLSSRGRYILRTSKRLNTVA